MKPLSEQMRDAATKNMNVRAVGYDKGCVEKQTLIWASKAAQLEDAVIDLYKQRMGLSSTIKLGTGLFAHDLYIARLREDQN